MPEVVDWLKTLGMSEYAERFAENKIDVSVLRHLNDQDLKDIGVALGHRRKILAAITEFADAAPAVSKPVLAAEPKTRDFAERRQVTVLFSDLVGSTALSARMDPEDLREVISAYQKCVAETVQRFGGFVAKYMATTPRQWLSCAFDHRALVYSPASKVTTSPTRSIPTSTQWLTSGIAVGSFGRLRDARPTIPGSSGVKLADHHPRMIVAANSPTWQR